MGVLEPSREKKGAPPLYRHHGVPELSYVFWEQFPCKFLDQLPYSEARSQAQVVVQGASWGLHGVFLSGLMCPERGPFCRVPGVC